MKHELMKEYERQKELFLNEKQRAEEELSFINAQMSVIETEMRHCTMRIQEEKKNISFHQEHLSFKSPTEIEISLNAIQQVQENLLTFGELAFSFQSTIEKTLNDLHTAEKGIALCEDCLTKLEQLHATEHQSVFEEIKLLLENK